MNRRFISIRSKLLLLLGYFLFGLTVVVILEFYFENVQQNMEVQYRRLLEQRTHSQNILYLVTSLQNNLYEVIYRDNVELQAAMLAKNEDLLTEFEDYIVTSQQTELDQDYYFLLENQSTLLKLRGDVFRVVSLIRNGEKKQAIQLLTQHIEPDIFHIKSFQIN